MLFICFRAFGDFEFEDVRKLSAELSGRIHPQVMKNDIFNYEFKLWEDISIFVPIEKA